MLIREVAFVYLLRWVLCMAIISLCQAYYPLGASSLVRPFVRGAYPPPTRVIKTNWVCSPGAGRGRTLSFSRKAQEFSYYNEVAANEDPRVDETNLADLETWLNEIGVDRGAGEEEPPSVSLTVTAGQGLGLTCARDLERHSTVRSVAPCKCRPAFLVLYGPAEVDSQWYIKLTRGRAYPCQEVHPAFPSAFGVLWMPTNFLCLLHYVTYIPILLIHENNLIMEV